MSSSYIELVVAVQNGDQNAFAELVTEYTSVIRSIVDAYVTDLDEKEDIYQEGLLGLYKAAMTYRSNCGASFPTYSRICIKHSIVSALRTYYGKKNYPLISSVSIENYDDESGKAHGLGPVTDPECVLIEQEGYESLLSAIDVKLTQLERRVLKMFVQGMPYSDISKRLQISTKSVGNAVQRIRGKLKLFIKP